MNAYHAYSDQELAALLKEGNRLAYEQIYTRYKNLLYIHARKKTGDDDEAQDVVQDVFMMLWNIRGQLVITSNLSSFLYTCVHRKILNLFVHKKIDGKHMGLLKSALRQCSSTTDYAIREKQLTVIIKREIAALPPKMREVFELSRFHDLSHKEIATKLDISEETVKSQIKNALKILRVKLGLFGFLIFLIRF